MVKITLNSTSSPVTPLSPPVVWSGEAWMPPGCTELLAVKLSEITPGVKVRPSGEARESNATSDGELTREGTFPEGGRSNPSETRGRSRPRPRRYR